MRQVSRDELLELIHGLLNGPRFTAEQLAAITAPMDEPVVVIAGAGSGKTSVIAARVVWLVGTGAVQPEQVLGLTFTKKATGELFERIERALAAIDVRRGDGLPTVSTYDSFSATLVSEFGPRLGIESQLRMITDATRFQLASRSVEGYAGPMPFESATVQTLVPKLLDLESDLQTHRRSVDEVRAFDRATLTEVQAALAGKGAKSELQKMEKAITERLVLLDMVEDFQRAKQSANLAQFSDVAAFAADIATGVPQAREQLRDRFRVVMLDEYQDTSVSQRDLLVGLFGAGFSVTAVGDPCQAIYGWRGASVSNIGSFLADFGGREERRSLTLNTRSDGWLLRIANTLAALLRSGHAVEELRPLEHRASSGRTTIARLEHLNDELDFIVEQVQRVRAEWRGEGLPRIAVLTRAGTYLPAVQGALADAGIAADIVGRAGLLYTAEVQDLIATLDVLVEPAANASLLRLLTGPRWRIGMRDLALLGARAQQLIRDERAKETVTSSSLLRAIETGDATDVVSLSEAMADPGQLTYSPEALVRFQQLSDELRLLRGHVGEPPADLVSRVVRTIGLDIEVAADPAAAQGRGRDAIDTFIQIAHDYRDPDGGNGISDFLAYLRLAMDEDRGMDLDDSAPDASGEVVQLMTIHKSKGLEWDVVLTPFLYDGGFPRVTAGGMWTAVSHVMPWPLRGDKDDLPRLDEVSKDGLVEMAAQTKERARTEERRVAYVAFTRARHELIASSHAWESGKVNERPPSEFLQMLRELSDDAGWLVEQEWFEAEDAKDNPHFDTISRSMALAPPKGGERRRHAVELTLAAIRSFDADEVGGSWADWAQLLVDRERAARSEDRVVPLPMTLSATQTMQLAHDPERFALDLVRPMPRKPSALARRGTLFHLWVEDHFSQRKPMIDDDDLIGAADDDLVADDEMLALQERFLASPWADRHDVRLEEPFSLAINGRVLIGRVDAIFSHDPTDDDPTTVHIIDWKTGVGESDPLQLAIYRLAWSRMHGLPLDHIRAGFFYVRTGETKWHDDLVDEAELELVIGATA